MPVIAMHLVMTALLVSAPRQDGLELLFDAIRRVESGGRVHAVGDGGRSKGPYQIGRAYWKDACQYGKVTWSYDRYVWSRPRCEAVMAWYWQRYGARTNEQRARIHNGGPQGHRLARTLPYWRKVQRELASQ